MLTRSACAWAAPGLANPSHAACQTASLDTGAAHVTCCALGEATRGHNAVTALVHAAAQSCDCTAETEVLGLIPGTDLRRCPGPDCTQTRHEAKLAYDGPHLSSLLAFPAPRYCGVPMDDLTEPR